MREITLVLRTDGHEERRTVQAGGAPVTIGRNPSSDIAVADKRVSWAHARIWIDDGAVWVRDMGSRNGTGVDGERIEGSRKLGFGSLVNVAGVLKITVEAPTGDPVVAAGSWFLDDLQSGLRHPVSGGVFALVSTEPGKPSLTLTLKGEAWWLLGAGMAIPVEPGVPFSALGRQLVLAHTASEDMGTVGVDTQVR